MHTDILFEKVDIEVIVYKKMKEHLGGVIFQLCLVVREVVKSCVADPH